MSNNAPGVQNKMLLVVAIVLAIVVVVAYNLHVSRIRASVTDVAGTKLRLLRDIQPGQKIKSDDLESVPVSSEQLKVLGEVVDADSTEAKDAFGYPLNQAIPRGNWLRWDHLPQRGNDGPAANIRPGFVERSFPIDERMVPGDILRVGGRINMLAELPDGKGGFSTMRVVEGLRVHAVGGQGQTPEAVGGLSQAGASGRQSYRTIGVEVSKDVSMQLQNIMTHARRGVFQIEVVNPRDPVSAEAGQITKDTKQFASTAAVTK